MRATGAPTGIAQTVEGRGIIAYDRDELAVAAAFVAEAIEIYSSSGNLHCCAHPLEAAALIVAQAGEPEKATELLGAVEELRRMGGQATSHLRSGRATPTSRSASRRLLPPCTRPR